VAQVISAEADLAGAARRGDEEAFRRLVEPLSRELHVFCYRMLGSFHDAEDAHQETLLKAWRGLQSYDGRSG
jgi:RNA polymerase sigma-70 factor (ECF subfamily)